MNIRQATSEDEDEIVTELLQPSFREDEALDPLFNKLDEEALTDAGCEYWLAEKDRMLFVAEENDELLGHISGVAVEEPPIYARSSRVHIDGLYVKEDYRRQAVGSKLLAQMEEWAKKQGCEYLGVAVHRNNEGARNLYEGEFNLTFLEYRRKVE